MRVVPVLGVWLSCVAFAAAAPLEKGTVAFAPLGDQKEIPERYRLAAHQFEFEMEPKTELAVAGVQVFHVRFPSPVESPHKENNTVHCEYYRPKGDGPFPATIVLDITGGNQDLSRTISTFLAQKGIACFFVQMAYYGPRRPPGSKIRLMSPNFPQTFAAVRQTVLDVRRAVAWLSARKEVDSERLGLIGTSLGSLIGSLSAEMEPRIKRVVVLLGGADLVEGFWDHPQAAPYFKLLGAVGVSKKKAKEFIAPIDPITCAANLKDRKMLIIAGKKDEIIAPKMAEALWAATGKQKIVWFDCGHYTSALYFLPAMKHIAEHLTAP